MPNKKNIFALVLAVTTFFFLDSSFAQQPFVKSGKDIIYNGNTFTFVAPPIKEVDSMTQPEGRTVPVILTKRSPVSTINGKKIYNHNEVKTTLGDSMMLDRVERYLLERISRLPELQTLPDGNVKVKLNDFVLDTAGKIGYYNFVNISFISAKESEKRIINIDENLLSTIILNSPRVRPITVGDQAVNVRLNISLYDFKFEVKDHRVTYTNGKIHSIEAPVKPTKKSGTMITPPKPVKKQ